MSNTKQSVSHKQRNIRQTLFDVILLRRIDARIIALVLAVVLIYAAAVLLLGRSVLAYIVASGFSITASLFVAMRIRAGLAQVGRALGDVTEGRLDYRLDVRGGDAISNLARSFNAMVSSTEKGMEQLRQERSLIRSIHQGITGGIIVFDRLGRVISANPSAEAAIGKLERDIMGTWDIGIPLIENIITAPDLVPDSKKIRCQEAKQCTHPECPSYESEDLRCWLQCGTCCHNEIQGTFSEKRDACERCDVYQKNGIAHTDIELNGSRFAVTISPILDQSGHEEGRIALLSDVTEITEAREKLERKNDELKLLNNATVALSGSLGDIGAVLEQSVDIVMESVRTDAAVIIQTDPETGAVKQIWSRGFSPELDVLLQTSQLELDAARRSQGFVSLENLMFDPRGLQDAFDGAGLSPAVAMPIRHRARVHGAMIMAGGGCGELPEIETSLISTLTANMGVAIQNQELFEGVTKAKQAWEATFDAMGDAVSLHDTDFNILQANAAMARYTKKPPAELVGKKCYEVIHGSSEPSCNCPVNDVMRTGRSYTSEIAEEFMGRRFHVSVNPVRDAAGESVGVVHVMKDVTEREQLREQLLQSEKMAAVGQLVSGVAHELNNPLTGVLGFSQLLMRKCDGDLQKVIGPEVEAIAGEAQRASRIVQNLLSFARKHKAQKGLTNVNEAIRTVMDLRAYDLNVRNIRLEAELDAEIPLTMADVHQIEQVFLNIINNAEQAITATGKPGAIIIVSRAIGGNIEVTITDTATGITPEVRQHIFEPFFTTKEVGQGTGLGLSICYGIMEEHGGDVRVASTPAGGASFTVVLPVTEAATIAMPPRPVQAAGNDPRRRILVVDDEPAIVDLLTDILTLEGHGVDIARNGRLALEKLGNVHYDNIITDIKMPEMDGKELHRRITEIDPQLAANVIFITGDAIGRDTRDFLRDTGSIFLTKPFNIHELRDRLHKVINGYE